MDSLNKSSTDVRATNDKPIEISIDHLEGGRSNQTTDGSSSRLSIKILLGIILLVPILAGSFFFLGNSTPLKETEPDERIIRIGLSLDTLKTQRWALERDIITAKALEQGAVVTTLVAEGSDEKQISHIENFISQKVDVIIVVPHSSTLLNDSLAKAQAAGIKVINYDRLTRGSTPDLYLSFDSIEVGELGARYVIDAIPDTITIPKVAYFAGSPNDNNAHLVSEGVMRILQPLIVSGEIDLVYNEFTTEWSPDVAYRNLQNFLAEGGQVDAVITASDSLAYGIVQALKEYGLAGKVPVSGQDGELQAMHRLLEGTQTVSAYKPGRLLAEMVVIEALRLANGESPITTTTVNNDLMDVPSYLFDPIAVTRDNIDSTVIADGTYTRSQIYTTQ